MSKTGYFTSFLAGIGIGIASTSLLNHGKKSNSENPTIEQRIQGSFILGKAKIRFRNLERINDNEFIGTLDGVYYIYRFDSEDKSAEVYMTVKR